MQKIGKFLVKNKEMIMERIFGDLGIVNDIDKNKFANEIAKSKFLTKAIEHRLKIVDKQVELEKLREQRKEKAQIITDNELKLTSEISAKEKEKEQIKFILSIINSFRGEDLNNCLVNSLFFQNNESFLQKLKEKDLNVDKFVKQLLYGNEFGAGIASDQEKATALILIRSAIQNNSALKEKVDRFLDNEKSKPRLELAKQIEIEKIETELSDLIIKNESLISIIIEELGVSAFKDVLKNELSQDGLSDELVKKILRKKSSINPLDRGKALEKIKTAAKARIEIEKHNQVLLRLQEDLAKLGGTNKPTDWDL